jgi:hypothetical protein
MKKLVGLLISCFATLSGACSAPHAARVRCDAHLVPINERVAPLAGPLASAGNAPDVNRLLSRAGRRSLVP